MDYTFRDQPVTFADYRHIMAAAKDGTTEQIDAIVALTTRWCEPTPSAAQLDEMEIRDLFALVLRLVEHIGKSIRAARPVSDFQILVVPEQWCDPDKSA